MIGKIPGKRKDGKSSFRDLVSYCMAHDPIKAAHVGCRHVVSPKTAASEMEAVATFNGRCKDPVFHLILSWREMETPTDRQVDEAVRIALDELGLQDCQALWVLQRDTENQHVHIVINRIHPETFRAITPANGWTYKAVEKAARKIELIQGWESEQSGFYIITEDGEIVEKTRSDRRSISQNAKDSEAHTAAKSAERIAQEVAADIIRQAQSWRELHENLARQGIAFEKKGSGAILFIGDTAVKASTAGRDISLSKLCERLGTFEPRSEGIVVAERQPEPVERVEKSGVRSDWERYQEARVLYFRSKSEGYAAMRERHRKERTELREIQKSEREIAFAGSWKGRGTLLNRRRSVMAAKQQGEKLDLADIQKREQEAFRKQFPRRFCNFKAWLSNEENAQTLILGYRYPDQGAIFAAPNGNILPSEADLRLFRPRASNRGGVAYVAEGSQQAGFIDYGKKIILAGKSGEAEILAALQLANQKWGAADIQGAETFKEKCVELAARHNLRISNSDLAQQVEKKRKERERIQEEIQKKETAGRQRDMATGSSTGETGITASPNSPGTPGGAYWRHYRDIVSKLQGSHIDYSRVDAMIGIRMRVTGHSQDEVRNAIESNGPAMRRETMSAETYEAKYRHRDWSRYAAETTDKYVFGARGAVRYEKALPYQPLYLRLEGRAMSQQQETRKQTRGR